jgi:hypothetical protein
MATLSFAVPEKSTVAHGRWPPLVLTECSTGEPADGDDMLTGRARP